MSAALVRAELRKIASTRLWWGLALPVAALAVLLNVFGGLVGAGFGAAPGEGTPALVLASIAYGLSLATVFAALHGVIATAGEFRHRTITTAYLTAPARGAVLAAKVLSGAAVGAGYALVALLLGLVAGLVAQAGGGVPPRPLLGLALIGIAVCALWGALGVAVGTVFANQVTALVLTLVYMLVAETLLGLVLITRDSPAVAGLSAYLPVNAGDVALYDVPARELAGPAGAEVAAAVAGVVGPLPWATSLLVLAAWTAAGVAAAWAVGARRDIT